MRNGPVDTALTVISKDHSLTLRIHVMLLTITCKLQLQGNPISSTQSPTQMQTHTHTYIRIVLVKDESVLLTMLDDAENEVIGQFFYPM